MSTRITRRIDRQDDNTGALVIVLQAELSGGLDEVWVRRNNRNMEPTITWSIIPNAHADDVAIIYDMLGKAIQIARDIDIREDKTS